MRFSNNSNGNSGSSTTAPHSTNAAQQRSRQQTTTQQIIAENVKHLIEQLEQGKSEALTAYLNAMARFHSYSFGSHVLLRGRALLHRVSTSSDRVYAL